MFVGRYMCPKCGTEVYTEVCHNCKAKLSYVYKDVQKMYDDILNDTFYYIECPLCKTKIFIKDCSCFL